jgi:translation initiation factor 5A
MTDKLEDYDFSNVESGASETVPMEAGQIRKGGLMMIKGQPCKVIDVSTSKTGKHGHAKCNFLAQNIFNNKKLEDMIPSTHTTNVPIVKRTEYTLMDISDDGFLSLIDDNGETREDLELPEFPENYARELREAFETKQLLVTVLKACGKEQVVSHKEDQ